jgi:hypothetical protein
MQVLVDTLYYDCSILRLLTTRTASQNERLERFWWRLDFGLRES